MDPITPTLVLEAWKVGGIVGGLLAIIGLIVWLGWKDSRARERRQSHAIEECQAKHVEIASATATIVANNTNAMLQLCQAMGDRPCLKDPTPPGGHRHPFPTPRPPTDNRF